MNVNLPMKLVTIRKEKGLTQLDLAEKLNVSRQAISRWESGTAVPSTDNLKVLSELYGVSIDYLLNDAADDPPKSNVNQEEKRKELEWKTKTVRRMGIILGVMGVLMIAMILVIILCVMKIHKQDQPEVISITDLSCDPVPNGYPIETAHLIPMD